MKSNGGDAVACLGRVNYSLKTSMGLNVNDLADSSGFTSTSKCRGLLLGIKLGQSHSSSKLVHIPS